MQEAQHSSSQLVAKEKWPGATVLAYTLHIFEHDKNTSQEREAVSHNKPALIHEGPCTIIQ
ncbi:hypothetical protein Tco_1470558, partial [Tanacetum coccineum]